MPIESYCTISHALTEVRLSEINPSHLHGAPVKQIRIRHADCKGRGGEKEYAKHQASQQKKFSLMMNLPNNGLLMYIAQDGTMGRFTDNVYYTKGGEGYLRRWKMCDLPPVLYQP